MSQEDPNELISGNEQILVKEDENPVSELASYGVSQNVKEQLSAAPMALRVLCQLCTVAAKGQDFSLIPKNQSYNATLYPSLTNLTSFKSCLSDVGNATTEALMDGYLTMDFFFRQQIQMGPLMSKVEKLLVEGSPKEIKQMMPIYLRGPTRITKEGEKKIEETIKKFNFVIQVLEQLISAVQATDKDARDSVQTLELSQKINLAENKYLAEDLQKIEEEKKEADLEAKEMNQKLKDSIENLGSVQSFAHQLMRHGADSLFNTVLPTLTMAGGASMLAGAATNVEFGLTSAVMLGSQAMNKLGPVAQETIKKGIKTGESYLKGGHVKEIQRSCDELASALVTIETFFKSSKILDFPKFKDSTPFEGAKMIINGQRKTGLELHQKSKSKEKTNKLLECIDLINNLISAMEEKAEKDDETGNEDLYKQLQKLKEKVGRLNSSMAEKDAEEKEDTAESKESKGTVQSNMGGSYTKEIFLKVEMLEARKKDCEELREKIREREMEKKKRQLELCTEMEQFQFEEATKRQVMAIIQKGLEALVEMRDQWNNLRLYFSMINNTYQTTLGPQMAAFVETSDAAAEMRLETGEPLSAYMKTELSCMATEVIISGSVISFLAR
jgi:hypothetical protein